MPVKLTQLTFYSMEPRSFFLRGSTDAQAATNPLYVSLMFIRKGTVFIDGWVDVNTAAGAAGTSLVQFRNTNDTVEAQTLISFDGNAAALTRGPATSTTPATGPYSAATLDGSVGIKKVGTGAGLVFSLNLFLLRPNMTP